MKKCLFCNNNPATQTDSHIFSDFMTYSLRRYENISRVYSITKDIKTTKPKFSQDTPKESYLFCHTCEQSFGNNFERRIASTFFKDIEQKRNRFSVVFRRHDLVYDVYHAADYVLFKKFLFLQLYRLAVCSLAIRNNVNLTNKQLAVVHKNLSSQSAPGRVDIMARVRKLF
jgi:hypothetical protein